MAFTWLSKVHLPLTENGKHVVDMATMPASIFTSAGVILKKMDIPFWFNDVINPILAGCVLLATLVWWVYRISNQRQKSKDSE